MLSVCPTKLLDTAPFLSSQMCTWLSMPPAYTWSPASENATAVTGNLPVKVWLLRLLRMSQSCYLVRVGGGFRVRVSS